MADGSIVPRVAAAPIIPRTLALVRSGLLRRDLVRDGRPANLARVYSGVRLVRSQDPEFRR
jgi:hypothetical protein